MREKISTDLKALKINLDQYFYGTFAEIGAGQEVARNFFKAGGASGTIAKTMSAYDMIFSNAIYGEEANGRYVSVSRLHKMLDHEYELLLERLKGEKYEGKRFFAFANTVTTLNFSKTNEPHGWMGVKFQTSALSEANEVILHVKLLDSDSSLQQNVLGILGVNLLYACDFFTDSPNDFLDSLMDNIPLNSIEIDMLSMKGEAFKDVDNRLLSLILVTKGYSKVACFLPDGSVAQPKDLLYKKNLAILRARFRPVTNLNIDMIESGLALFKKDNELKNEDILMMGEITLNNLVSQENIINIQDFLDRADMLCSLGYPVLVSNFPEHHELTSFLTQCKPKKIAIILGVMNLLQILDTTKYENPISQMLLQFGNLFSQNVKLYAYPYRPHGENTIYNSRTVKMHDNVRSLYEFMLENNLISDIEDYNEDNLNIHSAELINNIRCNAEGWEKDVPKKVELLIKDKCLFDYPCDIELKRKKINTKIFEMNRS